MIELWGRRNSNNVMAVLWALDELNVEYKRYDVGGSFGGLNTESFLAMNPNGKIPVIKDRGKTLYESTTIIRYLATAYGNASLWAQDPYEKAIADQWMDWCKSTFYPAFHPLFWGLIRTPESERDLAKSAQQAINTAKVLQIANNHLEVNDHLGGEYFSIADIPLGACIYRYYHLDIERPPLPALERWYSSLTLRPAYQKHIMIPFGQNLTEWLELESAGSSVD
ncbi:MAG: glutathione S-transferase [Granulosicoccus sp.]|nr:glutathione S-transferase [Granulosicoccus sp.]